MRGGVERQEAWRLGHVEGAQDVALAVGELGALLGALSLAVLLSAVWLGAFCVCGLASAVRSSLWTMDTLR